jgi:hypothetical protein
MASWAVISAMIILRFSSSVYAGGHPNLKKTIDKIKLEQHKAAEKTALHQKNTR